jgi:hypothetical protein
MSGPVAGTPEPHHAVRRIQALRFRIGPFDAQIAVDPEAPPKKKPAPKGRLRRCSEIVTISLCD